MRWTSVAARSATESGGATRSIRARSATSPLSVAARTAAGSPPTSARAPSRNCLASSTSAGASTRPPRAGTPVAYSLAAREVAATMRRATDRESLPCAGAGAGEPHVGLAVGRTDDFDLTPPDPTRHVAPLERLVDGFLRGEPHRHVGRGIGPALAIGALGGSEEALEHPRPLVGDDRRDAGHFDEIDTDPDRAHGERGDVRIRGAPRATRARGGSRRAPARPR